MTLSASARSTRDDVPDGASAAHHRFSGTLTLLFAVSVGILVVNLFVSQPLAGVIGPELGLGPSAAGLVTMLTLAGYAAGLVLLVPLTDRVENRRLILRTLIAAIVALAAAAVAPSASWFLAASFAVGVTTTAIQMLIPLAAALAPEEARGRVVGEVMAGLTIGVLLARPASALIAESFGWRGVFGLSALLVAGLTPLLVWVLPHRRPAGDISYGRLIASLGGLLRSEPILRDRSLSAFLSFAAFNIFWTAVALRLSTPPFSLDASGFALFALAGVGGAAASPIAGRLGDAGRAAPAMIAFHGLIIGALFLAIFAAMPISGFEPGLALKLGAMALAAALLDVGVVGDQTLGRRAVNLIRPEARGRINGLFTGTFFLGGAIGSALSGIAWAAGGWNAVMGTALLFGVAALGVSLRAAKNVDQPAGSIQTRLS